MQLLPTMLAEGFKLVGAMRWKKLCVDDLAIAAVTRSWGLRHMFRLFLRGS